MNHLVLANDQDLVAGGQALVVNGQSLVTGDQTLTATSSALPLSFALPRGIEVLHPCATSLLTSHDDPTRFIHYLCYKQ